MTNEYKLRHAAQTLLEAAVELNHAAKEVIGGAYPLFELAWGTRAKETRGLAAQALDIANRLHREAAFIEQCIHASPERRAELSDEDAFWGSARNSESTEGAEMPA